MMLGMAALSSRPADAVLFCAACTVNASFDDIGTNGVTFNHIAKSPGDLPVVLSSTPANLAEGSDGTTIQVTDTRIIITNNVSEAPFCFANVTGTACTDDFVGFDFVFTNEHLLSLAVSFDPASASGFLPVSGTFQGHAHSGLQVIGDNELKIDATGDLPLLNDQLIIDFALPLSPPPPPIPAPEPASMALLGGAVGVLDVMRRRRRRSN